LSSSIVLPSFRILAGCHASLATLFFFFSSRRRHTRSKRDWSSDVCSSDLKLPRKQVKGRRPCDHDRGCDYIREIHGRDCSESKKIGRASCRGRGESWGGAGSWKRRREPTGAAA